MSLTTHFARPPDKMKKLLQGTRRGRILRRTDHNLLRGQRLLQVGTVFALLHLCGPLPVGRLFARFWPSLKTVPMNPSIVTHFHANPERIHLHYPSRLFVGTVAQLDAPVPHQMSILGARIACPGCHPSVGDPWKEASPKRNPWIDFKCPQSTLQLQSPWRLHKLQFPFPLRAFHLTRTTHEAGGGTALVGRRPILVGGSSPYRRPYSPSSSRSSNDRHGRRREWPSLPGRARDDHNRERSHSGSRNRSRERQHSRPSTSIRDEPRRRRP
ncbi:hypothetical protein BKA70DRAFT_96908 [Coprinopsis sp. MPI-PUGE-AT-0042]|nr:hypothetical protein BKA70DRAFT_96908 [Coprinopsis sp. MPI-PUGE-AT-0042]